MASTRASRLHRRAPVIVFGSLALIMGVRLVVDDPALGLSFFSVLPVTVAAFVYGRRAAVLVALVAAAVFLAEEALFPSEELKGSMLAVATIARAAVFLAVALVITELVKRQQQLVATVERQEQRITDLEALQQALTPPDVPQPPRLAIAAAYAPAEGLVAGDFFVVTPAPGGATTLIIGDVVGHGLPAARRAAFARTTLATFASFTDDPSALLALANTAMHERDEGASDFVTALCATIGPEADTLVWASAGHPAPWDLDGAGPLPASGHCPPLGVARRIHCENATSPLAPGQGVLLFTDGLIEARRARRDGRDRAFFGEEAARTELRRWRGATPAEIVEALRQATMAFVDEAPADDLCLVAVRVQGQGQAA